MEREFEKRLKSLKTSLEENRLDAILLIHPSNIFYLTGIKYYFQHMDIMQGIYQAILILKEDARLLTYVGAAGRSANVSWMQREVYDEKFGVLKIFRRLGSQLSTVGVEGTFFSFVNLQNLQEVLPSARIVDCSNIISEHRMIKSEYEISLLSRACSIADQGMRAGLKKAKPGNTEIEVAIEAERQMQLRGAEDLAYKTWVGSGKSRTGSISYLATNRRIRTGDQVSIDLGAVYAGYCSDLCRTKYIGKIDPKLKKIKETSLCARQEALDRIRPGTELEEINRIVDAVFEKADAKQYLLNCSHGFGIDVVEPPLLAKPEGLRFSPGMTMTLEFLVTIPEKGGYYIEDDLVMTDKGYKSLTRSEIP